MLYIDNAKVYKATLIKINPKHQHSSELNASAFFMWRNTAHSRNCQKHFSGYHSFLFPHFTNKCNGGCVLPNSECEVPKGISGQVDLYCMQTLIPQPCVRAKGWRQIRISPVHFGIIFPFPF